MNTKKLPFLQSQILEYLYLKMSDNMKPSIKELSELTGYPRDSKILLNAIHLLLRKGFVEKKGDDFDFGVPQSKKTFFKETLQRIKNQNIKYNEKLIDQIDEKNCWQLPLFQEYRSISDLNRDGVIHHWYDYLEDFPYSLLEESIKKYRLEKGAVVLDPFCGSGTTLVSSNLFGLNAIGIDANPLMCLVSEVKTTWDIDLKKFKDVYKEKTWKFISLASELGNYNFKNGFLKRMPKREINQWMGLKMQKEVSLMKDLISEIEDEKIKKLSMVMLGKAAFDASYVALCPGTTFYPHRQKEPFFDVFCKKIIQVYGDLELVQNFDTYGKTKIFNKSATEASSFIKANSIDFIITSPPYPNDLEYTRQTRLELYLLDFVKNMDDVQKLKKTMIKGSTKLIYKEDNWDRYVKKFKRVQEVAEQVEKALSDKNWGFDYPKMIREYFGGMYVCLKEFYKVMKKGSYNLQVVGDQTYKNIVIPVGKIFVEMAKDVGYSDAHIELFRTRRSTTHDIPLPEEIVVIKK
ncbi:site-specific DNA-methyltransferase [Candidatus Poribacteria bacterium]|nr:site-specific DNA-methyltransferase [Candidatus Poribacteria bacterium]